jgi:hypothetical protein
MGKRRYLAALETALQLISDDKLQAIVQTMVDMDAACRKKLGEQSLCCGLQLRAFFLSGGRGAQMLWRRDHCTSKLRATCPCLLLCIPQGKFRCQSHVSHGFLSLLFGILSCCCARLLLLSAEETCTKVKELLDTAASKGVAGATLMAAAVKTMSSVVEQEEMPKQDKLRVSSC